MPAFAVQTVLNITKMEVKQMWEIMMNTVTSHG